MKARILSERIEHRIEPEQRRSERRAAASAPAYGMESSFCKAAMARSGSPMLRCHPCEDLDRSGTSQGVFLDRIRGHGPFCQSQRGGLVTETHIGQREIANQEIIFRLFFEKRFQFAARLSPTFLGGGMVAGDFLRPA